MMARIFIYPCKHLVFRVVFCVQDVEIVSNELVLRLRRFCGTKCLCRRIDHDRRNRSASENFILD
jgi:hypothetical protein